MSDNLPAGTQPAARLHFSIGSFFSGYDEVDLDRGRLLCRSAEGPCPISEPQIVQPTANQWLQFWQEVDRIGVWKWLPKYESDVLDGCQWELELEHEGRRVQCYGSNCYPGSIGMECPPGCPFDQFLSALTALTGKSFNDDDEE